LILSRLAGGVGLIVVDSSVWIDFFNGKVTARTDTLLSLMGHEPLLVGDIILCEILQGARTEAQARTLEGELRKFEVAPMLNLELAVVAAKNYRILRSQGITIRKTIGLLIGTFCIAHEHKLLHDDRDFAPMETHLGLKTVSGVAA
jgi:predicted nucleic acid-binding protein